MKNCIRQFIVAMVTCLVVGHSVVALAATVYVAPTGSDDGGDGSAAKPFKTATKAVDTASAGATISFAPGEYSEPGTVVIAKLLTLQGSGSPQEDWDGTLDTLCRNQPCITTKSADRVFEVSGDVRSAVVLAKLAVLGPDRSATAGSSSYGIVADGVGVRLNNVTIVAGKGGSGSKGADGDRDGQYARGGQGGVCNGCDCNAAYDGAATQDPKGSTVPGGKGGGIKVNCPDPASGGLPSYWGYKVAEGFWGEDGRNGPEGEGGAPADSEAFSFVRASGRIVMSSAVSGSGEAGTPGSGGGGGGPGETIHISNMLCSPSFAVGGHGGDGTEGGFAGTEGKGGSQGGGAFGLVVVNAAVSGSALTVHGGQGGPGGPGGQGGAGSPGSQNRHGGVDGYADKGVGGCFYDPGHGGPGGRGGIGGAGGAGGGGAGGSGGPSIDVVLFGSAKLTGALRLKTSGGRGGLGNVGGKVGPNGTVAASGLPGLQQSQKYFPAAP